MPEKPDLKDKIITYEEFAKKTKIEIDVERFNEHEKIVLKCLGCKHRDLLFKFVRIVTSSWTKNSNMPDFYLHMPRSGGVRTCETYFTCPKCSCSMITIDPSELSKVTSWIL